MTITSGSFSSRATRSKSAPRTIGIKHFYIPSFSHRVIIYKGLLVSPSLERFYKDLQFARYETALAIYHSRYSTNTFPTWPLAHPFRTLAHNGEINTRRGNANWMRAREAELEANFWGADIDLLKPIIQPGGSDSAELDNALEAIVMSGRSILHAMTMLVPPAWRNDLTMSDELRAFYDYHRCLNEPWDGPAALCFTDGVTVGACLDRNGLRPARYKLTDDGIFSIGSEVGTIPFDDAHIIEKGRLAPGEMIAIDTAAGKLLRDAEIKAALAARRPYGDWMKDNLLRLSDLVTEETAGAGRTARYSLACPAPDRVWLYRRGDRHHPQADGEGSRGGDRLDGRRYAARGALAPAAAALHLFQATLRAGHQSADRSDPREARHVPAFHHGLAAEPARRDARARAAHRGGFADPPGERNRSAALPGNAASSGDTIDATWPLSEGEEGLESAITRICDEAEAAVVERRAARHSERPLGRSLACARADAARHWRGASSPHPHGQAHEGLDHCRDGRSARRASDRLSHRLRRERAFTPISLSIPRAKSSTRSRSPRSRESPKRARMRRSWRKPRPRSRMRKR